MYVSVCIVSPALCLQAMAIFGQMTGRGSPSEKTEDGEGGEDGDSAGVYYIQCTVKFTALLILTFIVTELPAKSVCSFYFPVFQTN